LLAGTRQRLTQVNYGQFDQFGTRASRKPREEHLKIYRKKLAAGDGGLTGPSEGWEPADVREMQANHGKKKIDKD